MGERLRVGVVGCGIGQTHVRAYESLPDKFEVVAICDLDQDRAHEVARAREVATAHDVPRIFTDLAELCRVDDLDVINICTPRRFSRCWPRANTPCVRSPSPAPSGR
jgi:predicted dehydrogenase